MPSASARSPLRHAARSARYRLATFGIVWNRFQWYRPGAGTLGFLSNPSLSAQVATGSIVGTVTDASNQVVPGAQATIREVNRNTTTTLMTDASGVYTAPFLVPGTYEVPVELQGFFWEHEGNRAVRSGNWKLVSRDPDGWELDDIAAHRVERNDLGGEHPDVVRKLASEWEAWAVRTNVDRWPGPRLTNWGDPAPSSEHRR